MIPSPFLAVLFLVMVLSIYISWIVLDHMKLKDYGIRVIVGQRVSITIQSLFALMFLTELILRHVRFV